MFDPKLIKARVAKKIQAYENLQALRRDAGLTQAKIAQELDMPQGNISIKFSNKVFTVSLF